METFSATLFIVFTFSTVYGAGVHSQQIPAETMKTCQEVMLPQALEKHKGNVRYETSAFCVQGLYGRPTTK